MPLIKDNAALGDDSWIHLDDHEEVPSRAAVIVSLARWQRDRVELLGHDGGLGARLAADESPVLIADDLDRFAVVALTFPAFKDGRAFSYARLLRERLGYTRELRAIGNVLRDQAQFMLRCGFDTFEVEKPEDADAWRVASEEISTWYQPTGDERPWAMRLRHARQLSAE
tara:strand:- start:71 stop:580 length:510 start_codon:yes stop_codon:yes gene_type:complete